MFILKYLENSDAACTSEVELFATEAEAHSKMETQYEATVRLLGGNFLSEELDSWNGIPFGAMRPPDCMRMQIILSMPMMHCMRFGCYF